MAVSRREAALGVLREYCEYSSVHGVRYLSRSDLSWWSKLFWIATLGTAAFLLALLVTPLWKQYALGATEVQLISTQEAVKSTDFPAVYLCPSVIFVPRLMRQKLLRHVGLSEPLTEAQKTGLDLLMKIMNDTLYARWISLRTHLNRTASLLGRSLHKLDAVVVTDLLLEAFPACSDWLAACWWQGQPFQCCGEGAFQLYRGITRWCYTINSFLTDDMLDSNCTHSSRETDPLCKTRRGSASGVGTGLAVRVQDLLTPDENALFSVSPNSFTFALAPPWSKPPRGTEIPIQGANGQEVRIPLHYSGTNANPNILDISMDRRPCRYSTEGDSRSARYNPQDCEMYNQLNRLSMECGCFPLPRKKEFVTKFDGPSRPCNITELMCVGTFADDEFHRTDWVTGCPPLCADTFYTIDIRHNPVEDEDLLKHEEGDPHKLSATLMTVFFQSPNSGSVFMLSRIVTKDAIFGIVAGLCGLMLGSSVLAVAEVLYYAFRLAGAILLRPQIRQESPGLKLRLRRAY